MKKFTNQIIVLFFFLFLSQHIFSQQHVDSSYRTVPAGHQYKRSGMYKFFWGRNYRKEWATPVKFPVIMFDTLYGGITSFKEGGAHQSRSLHLKAKNDKEYALRSVDKTLNVLIPDIMKHTFIQHLANDQISMSHPYSALGIPVMAEAANIYHANPHYVYVPAQSPLDTFNNKYGNTLYLLEERPSGDWKGNADFGNFDKFLSSDKLREKLQDDNSNTVDQAAFVKARLFDFIIGDWDRHEDQWKWGEVNKDDKKIYEPVPTDRDQAFVHYNGLLLKTLLSATAIKLYMKDFDYSIKGVEGYSFERRNLDRYFTNKMTESDWQNAAQSLKQSLTDDVIERSVNQMPPEIFAISGKKIIAKLKSRRDNIEEYAKSYYRFLAREVEVAGTKKSELFEVKKTSGETTVNVYDLNKHGQQKDEAFYTRTFKTDETKEIRLYGISGNDVYKLDGSNNMRIRIIGGDERDSILNNSSGKKLQVYEDADNYFDGRSHEKVHITKDSLHRIFNYDDFVFDKKGIHPIVMYNDADRVFVGLGYSSLHHKWGKTPFASKQKLEGHYSISQRAFSGFYSGVFPEFAGKWQLALNGGYDAIHWTNFTGLGNETGFDKKLNHDYYKMQTKLGFASVALQRITTQHNFHISVFGESDQIVNNPDRFIGKNLSAKPDIYKLNYYVGGETGYTYTDVNNTAVPTKGIVFTSNALYSHDLTQSSQSYGRFAGGLQLYLPLIPKISLAITAAGATVTDSASIYHDVFIGGGKSLRGFKRERFTGKTAFYNQNELRFITDARSYIYNGKIGIVAFLDDGRVWMPSENSNTLHYGYGVGLLLVPYNKASIQVNYGFSRDGSFLQFTLGRPFQF